MVEVVDIRPDLYHKLTNQRVNQRGSHIKADGEEVAISLAGRLVKGERYDCRVDLRAVFL